MALGLAETAKLAVDLSLKGNFSSALAANQKALKGFDSTVSGAGNRAYRAGTQIGTGIKAGAYIAAGALGFLATNVGLGLRSLSELDDIVTQSNAVLKSTKGVAGQTTDSLRKMAEQYESLNATIDDKVIQSGENLLLTFTNIRKDAFEPALKAALDMNTALGRGESGLQGTIQQLGVALNDPIRGLTRLQRAGITFTQTQKDQIKAAVDAGDTFKAQGIILAELNKRYGGSFLAGGSTTTGKVAKFKDAIDDLQRALATALLPTIGKVSDRLSVFLSDPKVVKTISDLGESIAGLFSDKNLAEGGKILGTLFDTAKAAAPVLQATALATLNIVKTAVGLFTSLPKEVQQLAIGAFAINKLTGGLVTNVAGGIVETILGKLRSAVVNVQGAVVNVNGGIPGAPGVPAAAAGGLGLVGAAVALLGVGAVEVAIAGAAHDALLSMGIDLGKRNQVGPIAIGGPTEAQRVREEGSGRVIEGIKGGPLVTAGGFDRRVTTALDHALDSGPLRAIGAGIRASNGYLSAGFRQMVAALHAASGSKAIAAAAKAAIETVIGKGKGNVKSTENVLTELKAALTHTHDPKLAAILRADIRKVEAKLPARVFAEREVHAVEGMLSDGKVSKSELSKIKGIEQTLKDHGLPHAASVINAKLAAVQRAQVAAANATTTAVKNKESITNVNVPVTVSTSVSVSALGKAVVTVRRYGNRYTLNQF